jgi:hypothetical protein
MKKNDLIPKILEIYKQSGGNVSVACEHAGICRFTFYDWKKKNAKFAQQISDIDESLLDYAESQLIKNIKDGKETSLIFYLKTKGKNRGYIERIENDITINPFIELMQRASRS